MRKKKPDERYWRERLLQLLPETASEAVTQYARGIEEIHPPVIIYKRESVPEWDFENLITAGLIGPYEEKYHWGARCLCTACREEFVTGYRDRNILILQMEDGEYLEGWTDGEQPETVSLREGDKMDCPRCGTSATLRRRSSIGNGRQYTTQIVELTNIEETTVLLYWLATYLLEKDGYHFGGVSPRAAVAVSPEGDLQRFTHSGFTMLAEWYLEKWKPVQKMDDPELMPFNEGGGGYRSTVGGYYFTGVKDMQGTTGEKTGIFNYFRYKEAVRAASYLRFWKKHPAIENIVNTGGEYLAADMIRKCVETLPNGMVKFSMRKDLPADWKETKPHRILKVTKPEYRMITEHQWSVKGLETFREYRGYYPKTTAFEMEQWFTDLGDTMDTIKPVMRDGLGRIYRYLCRQEELSGFGRVDQYYEDYRRMLDDLRRETGLAGEPDEQEKFPHLLRDAHDRVSNALNAVRREKEKRGGTDEQFRTFAELKEKHKALEWKRGEFCIIIPESPEQLVREGETLHHCVGGYASQHCRGQMIFFVRHSRRPERSWFTLNENVNGNEVYRIQLHGYRNEFAHGKKLAIPKEVEHFVQEWEDTVLAPYLKNKNRRETA